MNNNFTEQIIGVLIEVHRTLGSGLLESTYQECLLFELKRLGLNGYNSVNLCEFSV